jgi:hypothetical protein
MVHVSLEDDWHILKVRDRARHDTASESPRPFVVRLLAVSFPIC